MTEESRAAAWRASRDRRRLAEQLREAQLRGSPLSLAAVKAAWQPLIDYLRERSTNG